MDRAVPRDPFVMGFQSSARILLYSACWTTLLSIGIRADVPDGDETIERPADCGANALFVLHGLLGKPTILDQIEQILGQPPASGFSMAELASASRALGVRLEGIQSTRSDAPPDSPVIALFHDGQAGHFAVVRPVGRGQVMVQVVDPPHTPRIMDFKTLQSDPTWTGRLLRPARWGAARMAGVLAMAGASLGCLTVAWRGFRRRRAPANSLDPLAEPTQSPPDTPPWGWAGSVNSRARLDDHRLLRGR